MFQAKRLMFLYCASPVHMGAGTAIGAIDNPIQREKHTSHPMMAGSGIKGAVRSHAESVWQRDGKMVDRLFGPSPDAAHEHAGALSFSDAQLVLFPVRSLHRSFVYATCPTALARLRRLAELAGVALAGKVPADLKPEECWTAGEQPLHEKSLVLETFQFAHKGVSAELKELAAWLSSKALPASAGHQYFRDKVAADLVLLHDDPFNHFVRHSTVVEPHVRIDDESGTADDGGLFYTENLPPESLLVSLVHAAREFRPKEGGAGERLEAEQVLEQLVSAPALGENAGLHDSVVQFGADATTGRGLISVRFA